MITPFLEIRIPPFGDCLKLGTNFSISSYWSPPFIRWRSLRLPLFFFFFLFRHFFFDFLDETWHEGRPVLGHYKFPILLTLTYFSRSQSAKCARFFIFLFQFSGKLWHVAVNRTGFYDKNMSLTFSRKDFQNHSTGKFRFFKHVHFGLLPPAGHTVRIWKSKIALS